MPSSPDRSRARARQVGYEPEYVRLLDGTIVQLLVVDLVAGAGAGASRDDRAALLADDANGRTVGFVSFTRVYGPRASVELDVDEALWHLGLPSLLLERLCERAARIGITTFIARLPAAQLALLALLRERFAAREVRDGAFVDVELVTTAQAAPER